jgi:hypothetical protein
MVSMFSYKLHKECFSIHNSALLSFVWQLGQFYCSRNRSFEVNQFVSSDSRHMLRSTEMLADIVSSSMTDRKLYFAEGTVRCVVPVGTGQNVPRECLVTSVPNVNPELLVLPGRVERAVALRRSWACLRSISSITRFTTCTRTLPVLLHGWLVDVCFC